MSTVETLIHEVADKLTLVLSQQIANGDTAQDFLLMQFNTWHKDFNRRKPWPWRSMTIQLPTVENYSTGGVSVTKGSRTVSPSGGAVFTSDMKGRFLKLDREQDAYEILDVSGGNLVLKQKYLGENASGLSYVVWKRFYLLPPIVPYSASIRLWKYPYAANVVPNRNLDEGFVNTFIKGFPKAWALYGIDKTPVSYSAGSISATKGSNVFTGAGTAFLDNIFEGTEIVIGKSRYNVLSVDSDAQFTAFQVATADYAAGTPYSATTKNRTKIALSSTPDPAELLNITFFAKQYSLGLGDSPDMGEGFEQIIQTAMYANYLEKMTSERAFGWLSLYEAQIKDAWLTLVNDVNAGQVLRARAKVPQGYRAGMYSD